MRILSVAATREIDRLAVHEFGVPSMVLMENAAVGVADALCEEFPDAMRVAVFCGPGNNGGDGLAVARHLDIRGFAVELFLVGTAELEGDARAQEAICVKQGLVAERLRTWEEVVAIGAETRWDVAVDGLFGVGLSRPLGGVFARVVDLLNSRDEPTLAIDLPSGLAGDATEPVGPHVEADLTVTFETPKPAHMLPPACNSVGVVVVADLGIAKSIAESVPGDLRLVTGERAATWWPRRRADAHKGAAGHVLVAAGSKGFAGAAVLTARGALRAGAGLVTCAVPEGLIATVDAASLESMTLGVAGGEHGGFDQRAVGVIQAAARGVLAIGPGVGTHSSTRAAVREVVLGVDVPVVVDASGLDAFVEGLETLRQRTGPTVLTPHPGELARLLGAETAAVVADRLGAGREAAARSGAVVLVKGQRTLVIEPEGGALINPTGNPGLASGGTGDVLTGVIAALLAQGLDATTAAALGAYVHGLAGDLAAAQLGQAALTASEVLEWLPTATREVEQT